MSLFVSDELSISEVSFSDLLESTDFSVLTVAKTEIEHRLATLRDAQISRLRQQVTEQAMLLGVTPAQLFEFDAAPAIEPELPDKKTSKAGVPKYRDLATGATWSGKGKPPAWMKTHLEAGGDKEDLRIGVVEA